jgi:hypothetical protein
VAVIETLAQQWNATGDRHDLDANNFCLESRRSSPNQLRPASDVLASPTTSAWDRGDRGAPNCRPAIEVSRRHQLQPPIEVRTVTNCG